MLCRSTPLRHKPSGVTLETPLLVPSFSSKGVGLSGEESEVKSIIETAAEVITGVYLISAYDVSHKYLPAPADLPMKPELIILDSGGYEISDTHDLSEPTKAEPHGRDWSVAELEAVLDAWPKEMPAIFVSYDNPQERKPFAEQIKAARALFKKRSDQLHCFLIKEETSTQGSLGEVLKTATAHADEFASFDVVGVTEKGLGASPMKRMIRIARLRRALDEASVKIPIHVFGSLDPISITLYYISGAEIFDGLTWLRYAFVKGQRGSDQCVYIHTHASLAYGVHMKDIHQKGRVMMENYYYLLDLTERLKHFQATKDFTKLPYPDFMQEASEKLDRELKKNG